MRLEEELVGTFTWVDGHADIWPWFADARMFASIVMELAAPFRADSISKVVGIEARAFLLAGAVARELQAGVVPIRKRGAIFPGPHVSVRTSPDYRGLRTDLLLQEGVLAESDRVLLVDDWVETGSQASAASKAIDGMGASVVGMSVIVDGSEAALRSRLPPLHALIRAESLGPAH
ncbi:MAG: phosphoribosyltransferase family protein [Actinomycetota bacterium]